MEMSNNPNCRKCGMEGETSAHVLCECEALASLRYTYLGSFFLDPEDVRKLGMWASWPEACICCRWFAGIAGSNPPGSLEICLL